MGTQGVPWNVPKSRILESIRAKKGVITHICKDLDVHYDTVTRHIKKDPELQEALDLARNEYDDLICDMSENTLLYAVSQREDLSSGIRAAQFVLNNKGRKRGYTPPSVNPDQGKQESAVVDTLLDGFRQLHASQSKEQPLGHSDSQAVDAPLPVVDHSNQ